MEKAILLLIGSISGIWVVTCGTKRKCEHIYNYSGKKFVVSRIQKQTGEANYEDQKKYEKLQHDDYLNNKDTYGKWPKMDHQLLKELCNIYMPKIIKKKQKFEFYPKLLSEPISLIYRIIKDENNEPMAPVEVFVLQCYFPKTVLRRYYHFIKGPRSHCLFLIKPLCNNWKHKNDCGDMVIVNEFCDKHDKYDQHNESSEAATNVKLSNSINAIKKRRIRKNDVANSELLTVYEQAHFNYCIWKPGDCKIWPELKNWDKDYLCKKLVINVLGPFVVDKEVFPGVRRSEKLIYVKIFEENNKGLKPSVVTVLQCCIPEARKIRRSFYQFIRAPVSNCVFLVKPTAQNLPQEFVIINKYCDVLDAEH